MKIRSIPRAISFPRRRASDSRPLRLTGTPGGSVDLAGREAGVRSSKLDIDRAQLCRLSGAAHRRLSSEFFELFHRRAARHLKRSPDRSRRDRVDPDAFRRKLLRQGFYVIHGCSFCLSVVVQVRGRIVRLLRGGAIRGLNCSLSRSDRAQSSLRPVFS
jgi:hypothetical protein